MLVTNFFIRGLHGYKDVAIDFKDKATIIVAENGSGKTTILNALYALLTCRFKRLGSIDFESMEVAFINGEIVEISKSQLNDFTGNGEELADQLASESGVSSNELIRFIKNDYNVTYKDKVSIRRHPTFRQLMIESPYTMDVINEKLDAIQSAFRSDDISLGQIKEKIKDCLQDIEVVFLPTYRRVEMPFIRSFKRNNREKYGVTRHGSNSTRHLGAIFSGMNFGLSDVEDRLTELADEVERRSNSEYRLVSARMVNQLLQREINLEAAEQYPLPNIDDLEMFFSRLEKAASIENVGALRLFYQNKGSDTEQQIFLRYFLGQLSQVIDQTRVIEEMVRVFVDACNKYLKMSSDEKSLAYVPESMKVEIRNSFTGNEVAMDALSSGEKQVISLLAKLYLEPSRKLILVDEPELSLSLDWQKRILLDIERPDTVEQFLAITHSPFVFDNELASSASQLIINRRKLDIL